MSIGKLYIFLFHLAIFIENSHQEVDTFSTMPWDFNGEIDAELDENSTKPVHLQSSNLPIIVSKIKNSCLGQIQVKAVAESLVKCALSQTNETFYRLQKIGDNFKLTTLNSFENNAEISENTTFGTIIGNKWIPLVFMTISDILETITFTKSLPERTLLCFTNSLIKHALKISVKLSICLLKDLKKILKWIVKKGWSGLKKLFKKTSVSETILI